MATKKKEQDSVESAGLEAAEAFSDAAEPAFPGCHVDKAVCAVKRDIDAEGGITKDKNGPQGYKFRGIDDVYNVLCSLTAKHGLALYPRVTDRTMEHQQTARGGVQTHMVLDMDIEIVSVVDGSRRTISVVGEAIDSSDKAAGKAQSYGMKIGCLMAFMIPTHGEPLDTEAYATEQAPVVPKEQAKAKQAKTKGGPASGDGGHPEATGHHIAADDDVLTRIGEAHSFPVLYAFAQDADGTKDPARSMLFGAIKQRAIALFAAAPDRKVVAEGIKLVQALGTPDDLKRAANEAHARTGS